MGNIAAQATNAWVRFANVTIPQGATITSAYVKWTAESNKAGTVVNVRIYANDVDNPTAPTDQTEANALDLTSASVDWNNVAGWTGSTQYNSPSIVTVIQEIVNRVGWSSGQALMCLFKDNGSDSGEYRSGTQIDYDSGNEKAELHVSWVEPYSSSSSSSSSRSSSSSSSSNSSSSSSSSSRSSSSQSSSSESSSSTSTASGTYYPAANSDDAYVTGASFYVEDNDFVFGNVGSACDGFVRFLNVTIPQGATITSAYVKFTCSISQSTTVCNLNCYFNDADNPSAPTDATEFNALDLTGAVAWSAVAAWTDGTQYDTPELKTILQTIVDRGGWASGQAIIVVVKDNGSDGSARRYASQYDRDAGNEKAELHVSWVA